jgi:membrane-bound lytic murein transglycosylase D
MNVRKISILVFSITFFLVCKPVKNLYGQIHIDTLIYSELPSFDEAIQTHNSDPYQVMADTFLTRIIPSVDMETIEDRASCLNLDMPLVINKTVCGFIHFFTVRKRNYTQTMLERKNYYFPIFEYYLRKHEMPDALKYLSIVESGLNFKAKSRTGALGLWQFMPGTGKDFYLAQNNLIDERQNPYLATEAACKFLKYLYRLYGDWELALAAYNCGPGNVNKALKKSGKRGFWEIYNYLPQETRSYVPQFHAVVYAMNFASEHNIFPDVDSILVSHPMDTFQIARAFDVFKLEAILGLPLNSLHHANPTLRTNVFPGTAGIQFLVPSSHSGLFASNLDKWLDSAKVIHNPQPEHLDKSAKFRWEFYSGKKGESIVSIANRFQTKTADLKKWNRLAHNHLKKSQKIKIRVAAFPETDDKPIPANPEKTTGLQNHWVAQSDNSDFHLVAKGEKLYQVAIRYGKTVSELKKINSLSSSKINEGQKIWLNSEKMAAAFQVKSDSILTSGPENAGLHTVLSGEGLFSISREYGISIAQLRQWNNLKSDILKTGQVLCLVNPQNENKMLASTDSTEERPIVKNKKIKSIQAKVNQAEIAKIYQVQKGDTLYSISRKFTHLTIKDLIRINKLKDKKLKPGQNLIIG